MINVIYFSLKKIEIKVIPATILQSKPGPRIFPKNNEEKSVKSVKIKNTFLFLRLIKSGRA